MYLDFCACMEKLRVKRDQLRFSVKDMGLTVLSFGLTLAVETLAVEFDQFSEQIH